MLATTAPSTIGKVGSVGLDVIRAYLLLTRRPTGFLRREEYGSLVVAGSDTELVVFDPALVDAIQRYLGRRMMCCGMTVSVLYNPADRRGYLYGIRHRPVRLLGWGEFNDLCIPGKLAFGSRRTADC